MIEIKDKTTTKNTYRILNIYAKNKIATQK